MGSQHFGKPISELVADVGFHPYANSPHHTEIQAAIHAELVAQLTKSIDEHERASSPLADQLLGPNVILGIFTVAGTVPAIVGLV